MLLLLLSFMVFSTDTFSYRPTLLTLHLKLWHTSLNTYGSYSDTRGKRFKSVLRLLQQNSMLLLKLRIIAAFAMTNY